jgi:hypothetical protein
LLWLVQFVNRTVLAGPSSVSADQLDVYEPPLRLFFGKTPLDLIKDEYAGRIETWEQWSDVSNRAHGPAKAKKHA